MGKNGCFLEVDWYSPNSLKVSGPIEGLAKTLMFEAGLDGDWELRLPPRAMKSLCETLGVDTDADVVRVATAPGWCVIRARVP